MNSRLDTIQAAILNRKLKSVLKVNEDRRYIAKIYDEKLKNVKQIKITKAVTKQNKTQQKQQNDAHAIRKAKATFSYPDRMC